MGIIPEINRAWITVDNKLFLWNYLSSDGGGESTFEEFNGMSEVIVSVSLSSPKEGVFNDTVKYVLVVASPVEVVLLAISIPTDTATDTDTDPHSSAAGIKNIKVDRGKSYY
jgi:nuclear pore complex protein Nup155